ncbi:hypothetical protein O181_091950 [Austropuccinia psidii MF-1]|uniref:Uncharacterized protein n=1 Tax=Austropuccinia psidii MF-1 TaxID=1389203 RepID=A0A9Q3IYR8_9BASI|nr:hypothetical protein [Austropuccinia psidii MF-1]
MLTRLHHRLYLTLTLPPSLLTQPHPFRLQSLCSCGTLKIYLLCHPQPSLRLILFAAYQSYACGVPSQHASISAPTNPYASAPPPLTILTLLQHPQPSLCLLPPA